MIANMLFSPRVARALTVQKRVIGALIVRDMKTRFGRSHLGYLLAIAWPLSHIFGIMGAQYVSGRVVPIGTDLAIFCATGVLPYMLVLYPGRQLMLAVAVNQPLLLFSVVKTIDMIIARAILEVLTSCFVCIIFFSILYGAGVDLQPIDTSEAIMAILATIYLGISVGFLNVVLFMMLKIVWLIAFILISLLMYVSSGAFLLSSNLSVGVRQILWYNPLFQCVEWLRSAYYDGYSASDLSRGYVLGVASCCLFLGLVGERLFRGRFYQT